MSDSTPDVPNGVDGRQDTILGQVKQLHLKDGDTLVFECSEHFRPSAMTDMRGCLKDHFAERGVEVKVLLLEPGIRLAGVIGRESPNDISALANAIERGCLTISQARARLHNF